MKIFKFILLLLILMIVSITNLQAQTYVIQGRIIDDKNKPLQGANITIPKIERGTVSDEQGYFKMDQLLEGNYQVVASFIGYQSQTKTIKIPFEDQSNFIIQLIPSIFESQPVVVTGSPVAVDPLRSPQEIISMSGREKFRLQSASLGETIESAPGIYNISAGAVAGKPIIRGQTGERIRILSDGIAQEYQQYGERHSPNIDPFNAEQVEIIKGAASLLYGSDAIGGAVNLIPERFHVAKGEYTEFNGSFTSAYHSNNNELTLGAKFGLSKGKFGLKGSLIKRNAGNFHTPESDTYMQTSIPGDPKFTGEIDHTDFEQLNGSISTGILTSIGLFSLNYDHYFNENNFLLPTGSPIGLRLQNQILTAKSNLPFGHFILRPKFSYQRNHRQASKPGQSRETLPDSANVDLELQVFTGRLEIEHDPYAHFSGIIGMELKYYDHENIGKVPLQPTGHFTNFSIFGFEEWSCKKITLNFGMRFDHRSQEFLASSTNPLLTENDKKSFSSLSGALGVAYQITSSLTATANIGRGFRTPSFYNLYVYGYHGGVFAFQVGNPDLKSEFSLDMSSSLRFRTQNTQAIATFYQNRISNYIFLYNAPDHALAPQDETFVFAHDQADAILNGFDLSFETHPLSWLVLKMNYSTISSEFAQGPHEGDGLPLMPADRICGEIKLLMPDLRALLSPYILFNLKNVSDKSAAGIYEPFGQFDPGIGPDIPFGVASTKAYSILDLGFGFDYKFGQSIVNFDFEISNLLNEEYRDFLDTYKGYSLAPGRSFNLNLNLFF